MAIVVYNTLSRRKEPFEPVCPGEVGIYLCGPTVYKPSHIGHAVGPIIFDAIKRYLVFRGFKVTWVVNITDVDDKLIDEAGKQKTTTFELAERIGKDYLKAMATLHVDGIDIMPKASEHMGEIIAITQRLIERGCAYVSGGDVYFDVTKDDEYGKLSNRKLEEQAGQRDLKSGEKRNPGDFALWKAAKPEEPDDVKFDSPWGKGRPGWHIECSAMASRYLGDTFDIHGGGLDLVFPHHENEVAQSECANGKPFAKYWLHHGLTRVNTKKISKSDASPEMQAALAKMTLHNLLAEYPGELVRFFVLSTHYRRPIEYTAEEFDSKRKGLDTFYRLFERVERLAGCPYAAADSEPRASARADLRTQDDQNRDRKGPRRFRISNLRSQIPDFQIFDLPI
jgi:cysteinyl-tRNA synthetase